MVGVSRLGLVAAAVWLVFALAAGCANAHSGAEDAATPRSDASPDDTEVDAHSTVDDILLLEAAWRASCARRIACFSLTTISAFDTHDCNVDWWPVLEDHVRSGTLQVDVDAARRCVAAIAALPECPYRTSGSLWDPLPFPLSSLEDAAELACDHLFVDDMRVCGSEVCPGTTGCVFDAMCGRHCDAERHPGDPCPAGGWCGIGLACLRGTCALDCSNADCRARGFDYCTDHECIRLPHLGEPCDFASPPPWCIDGTACDGSTCVAAVVPAGGACDLDHPCAPWLVCEPPDFVCRTLFDQYGTCESSSWCPTGTYCHADGTCTSDPIGAGCGSQVVGPFEFTQTEICPVGYTCVARACGHAAADGAPCGSTDECENGSQCLDGRCVRSVMPWEPCGADAACVPWLTCIEGRCTAHTGAHVGDPCRGDRCDEGRCFDGVCAWNRPGESCLAAECPLCVDSICQPYEGVRGTDCTGGSSICASGLLCFGGVDGASYCCP